MSTCCPDTLLQRPCVPSDRDAPVVWPPLPTSAASEVHFGDGAITFSLPHPSGLPPLLKCLCLGGSAAARKPVVQEKVKQSLHDVQNCERSCQCKLCRRSARTQKPLFQGAQTATPKSPIPEQDTHLHCYFPSAIRLWTLVLTGASLAVALFTLKFALTSWVEGRA